MKVENLRERLIKTAARSVCQFRVGAIGLNARGTAIASSSNLPRIPKRRGGNYHAEMRVMRSTPRSLKTIVICRLGRGGALRPIDPCAPCQRQADQMGVRIVSIS